MSPAYVISSKSLLLLVLALAVATTIGDALAGKALAIAVLALAVAVLALAVAVLAPVVSRPRMSECRSTRKSGQQRNQQYLTHTTTPVGGPTRGANWELSEKKVKLR